MQVSDNAEILFGTAGILIASLIYEYSNKKIDASFKE